MQEVIKLILHVQGTLNMYGKLQILCYLALIYLYFQMKDEKEEAVKSSNTRVFLYTGIAELLLWNPLVIYVLVKVFPEVSAYYELLYCLPIFVPIAYSAVLLLTKWQKNSKNYNWIGYFAGVIVVIALSGSIWPYFSNTVKATETVYGIPEAEMEALRALDQQQGDILLLAPNDLLQSARIYDGRIKTLYGRNLWSSSVPGTTLDAYAPELYQLYDLMQAPAGQEEAITKMASELGCNYLIVSNGKREQEEYENPRDPNQIPDLSVAASTWTLHGYEPIATTEYYHVLERQAS